MIRKVRIIFQLTTGLASTVLFASLLVKFTLVLSDFRLCAVEVKVGKELGRGEFGVVSEVSAFSIDSTNTFGGGKGSSSVSLSDLMASHEPPVESVVFVVDKPNHERNTTLTSVVAFTDDTKGRSEAHGDDTIATNDDDTTEMAGNAVRVYFNDGVLNDGEADEEEFLLARNNTRVSMATNSHRDGMARYAVKRLRRGVGQKVMLAAAIDLACEALFLRSLQHTNVIHLRGTVGIPGTPDFAILLDRLVQTLDDKLLEWRALRKKYRGNYPFGLAGCRRTVEIDAPLTERLLVCFDVARAMRSLKTHKILYRDLKPENIGFNVRGTQSNDIDRRLTDDLVLQKRAHCLTIPSFSRSRR